MDTLRVKLPKKSKVIETKQQIIDRIEEVLAESEAYKSKRKIDAIDAKIERLGKARRLLELEGLDND